MFIKKNNWKRAFRDTLPVLMGYLAMGAAAGILLSATLPQLPCKPLWAFFSSALSISGALQFILVGWIKNGSPLTDVFLLTLFLNLRYALYGLSLIDRFSGIPLWKKCYLIWTLTDETFALQCADKGSSVAGSVDYCLKVAFLDHCYWVTGVTSGALIGIALPFSTRGIDFAMTALFIVILVDQLREKCNRLPAIAGGVCALCARLIFPTDKILLPAMCLMIFLFLFFRRRIENSMGVNS